MSSVLFPVAFVVAVSVIEVREFIPSLGCDQGGVGWVYSFPTDCTVHPPSFLFCDCDVADREVLFVILRHGQLLQASASTVGDCLKSEPSGDGFLQD